MVCQVGLDLKWSPCDKNLLILFIVFPILMQCCTEYDLRLCSFGEGLFGTLVSHLYLFLCIECSAIETAPLCVLDCCFIAVFQGSLDSATWQKESSIREVLKAPLLNASPLPSEQHFLIYLTLLMPFGSLLLGVEENSGLWTLFSMSVFHCHHLWVLIHFGIVSCYYT